jgi:hypothetical protein
MPSYTHSRFLPQSLAVQLTHVARYGGIKGKYWAPFSTSVGEILYGLAVAYPAGKRISDWREFDAGHFISAGGGRFAILFDERNFSGCQHDSVFNQNHLLLYRRGLDAGYGTGTADALEERYRDSHFKGKVTKEWTKAVYERSRK